MAPVTSPPEQRTILYDVSRARYEQVLADTIDRPAPRFTYDRGTIEILVALSTEHEEAKHTLASLVETIAVERGIDIRTVGSMTFKREDLAQGFEPDVSIYLQNEPFVRSVKQIDPVLHPPPDLVIEIDISRQSLNKLPIYAGFRVPEVWRVRDGTVIVYTLRPDEPSGYDEGGPSRVLPPLDGETLTRFLADGLTLSLGLWVRSARAWARSAVG